MTKRRTPIRTIAAASVVAVITASLWASTVHADPEGGYPGWGYGMGPGMMGGYGPGMMGGYGPGQGMMGSYGPGVGMMGAYWGSGLDLTKDQQLQINKIRDELRKEHWRLMDMMQDQHARLRDLYQSEPRNQAAINEAYKNIGKLQQQMYDTSVDAQKRAEAILTKEQRDNLRSNWRRGPR